MPVAGPNESPLPRLPAPGATPALRPSAAVPSEGPSPFARLVRGLGHEVARGEALVRGAVEASNAGTMDAGQLLALQTGVYRYSEVVDLTARLVDHATGGLRTVMQGQ
jgi:hypothetical protein